MVVLLRSSHTRFRVRLSPGPATLSRAASRETLRLRSLLRTTMPYFSNLQQLLTGLVLSYSGAPPILSIDLRSSFNKTRSHSSRTGYRLALHPDGFISSLAPLARLVEPRWASVQGALGQEVRHEGELSGVCLLAVGYFYLWSVYTQDEKFKRNSGPSRTRCSEISRSGSPRPLEPACCSPGTFHSCFRILLPRDHRWIEAISDCLANRDNRVTQALRHLQSRERTPHGPLDRVPGRESS